ncbi:MAG: hypothetical protein HY791_22830 [Deltaproteobacteria bacterium]|nr:hypothetical protein [Deltaproteobacteria bacterium]
MTASSRLANAFLILGSVLFVLLLLAAAETLLRVLGPDPGHRSRLGYQQVALPIFEQRKQADGSLVYVSADPRLSHQSFLASKPQNGFRVFVFGESAVAGLGFSPNVTFVRHLQQLLVRTHPERTIEVVNVGIVALSSWQIKQLVEDVNRRYAPDLDIIYCGNNEFLEIHAEKYAQATASWLLRASDWIGSTRLGRLLSDLILGKPKEPSLSSMNLSHEDLRLTQDRIIEAINLDPREVDRVIDEYEANIDALTRSSAAQSTPVLLVSVASNWRWRGRSDLPPGWEKELTGSTGPSDPEAAHRHVLTLLDRQLAEASERERWEILFRRGTVHEAISELDAAREDFRAAMNADPHLRRALDRMNERVKRVATRNHVQFFDLVEALSQSSEHGIVGFDMFYDYVHFTPRGAVVAGMEIFSKVDETSLAGHDEPEAQSYVATQLAKLDQMSDDFLSVDEWLGIGFELARVSDRNLWKYDEMLKDLRQRTSTDPLNFRAWVYLGNAAFFRVGGEAEAAEAYEKALSIQHDPAVEANLAKLRARASDK